MRVKGQKGAIVRTRSLEIARKRGERFSGARATRRIFAPRIAIKSLGRARACAASRATDFRWLARVFLVSLARSLARPSSHRGSRPARLSIAYSVTHNAHNAFAHTELLSLSLSHSHSLTAKSRYPVEENREGRSTSPGRSN
jgi:hypothetical protein